MDQFLEKYKLAQLTQCVLDNLNIPINITTKEIEFFIKNHPSKTSLNLDDFTAELFQIFKEELTWILQSLPENGRGVNTS